MYLYHKRYFLLVFTLLISLYGFTQELPEEDVEFNNIDPNYSYSIRLEIGLPKPIANNALREYYSPFFQMRAGFLKNVQKKYLIGGYAGYYSIHNSLRDKMLSTLKRELITYNYFTLEAAGGYEVFSQKNSVFSIILSGGLQSINLSRKDAQKNELIAAKTLESYILTLTTSWTFFIEEKYTTGLFLGYSFSGFIYRPEELNYTQSYNPKNSQVISIGLSFNFGGGN